jgi:DNA-binding transcriptional LysR family regulator
MIDRLRIGIFSDHRESVLLHLIAKFRTDHPELQVQVCTEPSDTLLREFRRGEFDLVMASADEEQPTPPRWSWPEETAWGVASPAMLQNDGPIPLAVLGESSLTRRMSVRALEEAGLPYEIVYVGKSYASLIEAAAAGLGVVCWAKHRLNATGLHVIDHAPRLPRLVDVNLGIYVGEGRADSVLDDLASRFAAAVRPSVDAATSVVRAAAR